MKPTDAISPLDVRHAQRRLDRAASRFDAADFVHAATRDGLLARLEPIVIDAGTVVDLGAATGAATVLLARRFRRARVIAVDLSAAMLQRARKRRSWFSRTPVVQADAAALPFASHSIDVVFANLLLPWIDAPERVFAEIARVLRGNGLFLFSTLGPDSLSELRSAWGTLDPDQHVRRFPDMHDIGDAAVRARLRDPVLDVDRLTVTYGSAAALFADLTAIGARNSLRQRERSLAGAASLRSMVEALEQTRQSGRLSFELELVYGHCWGPGPLAAPGEFQVPASAISRRRP